MPRGCARTVAYHPTEYAIACGFDNGCVRIFDIASTSLLEEYQQHKGRVFDVLYSHAALRLFSAADDGTLTAYDVLHSYQPSRAYTATPTASCPCLAISTDDSCLVAGGLSPTSLLVFNAATLSVVRIVSLASDVHAVAFGPNRALFVSTAGKSLLSVRLPGIAALSAGESIPPATETSDAHRAVAEGMAVSRNGRALVTGGNDRMVKVWPTACLSSAFDASEAQSYVGHSDHVTKLRFSPDGTHLVSVGGGDAVCIWAFKGCATVDAAEVVDESVRQAEAERAMGSSALAEVQSCDKACPSPADILSEQEGGVASPEDEDHVVPPAVLAALRYRLARLNVDSDNEAVAADKASDFTTASEGAAGATEHSTPRKRFVARVVYQDDEDDEDVVNDDALEDAGCRSQQDGADYDKKGDNLIDGIVDEQFADEEDDYGDEDYLSPGGTTAHRYQPLDDTEPAGLGHGLASLCADGLQLSRLIGFSTHAHEHVLWQPITGRFVYCSGDTLVVDSVGPTSEPAYVCGGAGEISTLAMSADGQFVAVGSGGDTTICVYDLEGSCKGDATPALRIRLPGHDGGVQSLCFLGNSALASLGLSDGLLLVRSIVSGAPLLSAPTPPYQNTLAVSPDGLEITTGGAGGVHTWRVTTAHTQDGSTRAVLAVQPPRQDPTAPATAQVTSLSYLGPTILLAGDSSGSLALWDGHTRQPIASWDCSPSLSEIDLLHTAPEAYVAPGGGLKWTVIGAGVGEGHAVVRYALTVSMAQDGTGPADATLAPLTQIALDASALGMSWVSDASHGIVGTEAGSVWHVHWGSGAATPLVGAVPPPILQMATPLAPQAAVIATLSDGESQGEPCGALLWDAQGTCAAPLARIHHASEAATCVALSAAAVPGSPAELNTDSADGYCAVGYESGRVQLVSVAGLALSADDVLHVAPICCLAFGPVHTLVSAAADGEVRLTSVASNELLVPLALLRPETGVSVHTIDVLPPSAASGGAARWLAASEHQQVQVWALRAQTDPNAYPIISLTLEAEPILTLPVELLTLGWRCVASFCTLRPEIIACSGLTRDRRLVLYNYLKRTPLLALSLDEWPTSLAACRIAPLLAVAGASGRVKLVSYPAGEEACEAGTRDATAAVDVVDLELHCHNVRSLQFTGSILHSGSDDEIAQWLMPL